jgi:hypothetical protein
VSGTHTFSGLPVTSFHPGDLVPYVRSFEFWTNIKVIEATAGTLVGTGTSV